MQDTNIETVKEKLFSTKPSGEKFSDEIRNRILSMRESRVKRLQRMDSKEVPISDEEYQKISEISDFIAEYIRYMGKEQTIIDFQTGINLLNDYKKNSVIEAKIQIEEDADFGEKTFAAFMNVLQNYSVDVIKHYIKLGAVNNAVWNTKNVNYIDTDFEVKKILNKLEERKN